MDALAETVPRPRDGRSKETLPRRATPVQGLCSLTCKGVLLLHECAARGLGVQRFPTAAG